MEHIHWNLRVQGSAGQLGLTVAVCLLFSGCGLMNHPPPIDYFERDLSFTEESVAEGGLAIAPVTSVSYYLADSGEEGYLGSGMLSRREINSLLAELSSRHKNLKAYDLLGSVEAPLRPVLMKMFQTYSQRDYLVEGDIDFLRELAKGRARYAVFAKVISLDQQKSHWVGSGEDDSGSYDDYSATTTVVVDFKIYDLDLTALVWSGEITETKTDSHREHDYTGGVLMILAKAVGNIIFSAKPPPLSKALDESYETFAKYLFSTPEGEPELQPTLKEMQMVTRAE